MLARNYCSLDDRCTLPERIALARRDGLDYADFLQIVLADEVRRLSLSD